MKSVVRTTDLRDSGHQSWPSTVKADLAAASGLGLVAVVVLIAWLIFQWGFGNDAVLPWVAALVFDLVDDRETWATGLGAAAATGFAGFVFWTITQAIDAILVLTGMSLIPRVIDRLSAVLRSKGWVTPYDEMKWSTRWMIAYATGASAVCLVDVFATGERGLARRRRMVVTSVLLSSVTVGFVVGLVALAAVVAVRIPATADQAEVFIRFARNPLTWISIFAMIFLVGHLRSRLTSD